MKKILIIYGSSRKKYSYTYVQKIIEYIKMNNTFEIEIKELFLSKIELSPCLGCNTCIIKHEAQCKNANIIQPIIEQMDASDCIIFTTPVFVDNVSGIMKNFIDHMAYIMHRPRFFGKKAIIIASSNWTGLKTVTNYLSKVVSTWGFDVIATLKFKSPLYEKKENIKMKYEKIMKQSANILIKSILNNKLSSITFSQLLHFHIFRLMITLAKETHTDLIYWNEKGWMTSNYFTNIKVNKFSLLMAKIITFFVKKAF